MCLQAIVVSLSPAGTPRLRRYGGATCASGSGFSVLHAGRVPPSAVRLKTERADVDISGTVGDRMRVTGDQDGRDVTCQRWPGPVRRQWLLLLLILGLTAFLTAGVQQPSWSSRATEPGVAESVANPGVVLSAKAVRGNRVRVRVTGERLQSSADVRLVGKRGKADGVRRKLTVERTAVFRELPRGRYVVRAKKITTGSQTATADVTARTARVTRARGALVRFRYRLLTPARPETSDPEPAPSPSPTDTVDTPTTVPPGTDPGPTNVPGPTTAPDPSPTVSPDPQPSGTPTSAPTAPPVPLSSRVLAAGDIAHCGIGGDEDTAALLGLEPDASVLTLGDNVYGSGTHQEFADCFHPSWGQYRDRMFPAPGNHDYGTANAAGYFDYFGAAAGDPDKGYYSFDVGDWHLVSLNSNCSDIGGCDIGSPQHDWLVEDLAAHPALCTLAYMHHPRFSSGSHGDDDDVQDLWATLADGGAELMLAGHDHDYERFAPMNANGEADAEGMRMFVVGTGGTGFRSMGSSPNTQASNDDTHGVLGLDLNDGSYDWEFLPVEGKTYTDSGSTGCH